MKSWEHKAAGLGVGLLVYAFGFGAEAAIGVFAGSKAPDWMEVPVWRGGERWSLIPHRTITHWFVLWMIALCVSVTQPLTPFVQVCQGFCLGGLLHVLMDATTPMGVPMFSPARVRISLRQASAFMLVGFSIFTFSNFYLNQVGLEKEFFAYIKGAKKS